MRYLTSMSTPSDLLPHLRRARDLIDSCYADDLDVAIMAQRAGVSKYHFIRSFSAAYGQTPAQYLAHRRIERAQDLLRATNLTVTEVCMLVGYTSLGSFSAKFRCARRRDAVRVSAALRRQGRPAYSGLLRLHARLARESNSGEAGWGV